MNQQLHRKLHPGLLYTCIRASLSGSSQGQQQPQQRPPSTPTPPPPSQPTILSNLRPPSPTSPLGSEAREFIEPCVEFDATCDLGGRTALHLAIAHKHVHVVDVLMSHTGQCACC